MAKKNKFEILSFEFRNEEGLTHRTTGQASKEELKLNSLTTPCQCGQRACVGGVLYRCMPDPSGRCIWWRTTENCPD